MSVHLNDLSKVYLQQVAEKNDDSYLETDMNKRRKNNEKAIEDMKNTEAHKSMVKSARKAMGVDESLDPVGREDADIDNDGVSNDKNDKYISKRRKAVARAIAKKKMQEAVHATAKKMHSPHEVPSKDLKGMVAKAVKRIDTDVDGDTDNNDKAKGELGEFIPGVNNKRLYATTRTKTAKESFSNWRQDLREIIDTEESQKPIKEKKVSNKVTINPEIKEQVQILESVELSEEYINETVYGAVDYFMAEGLNDEGVEILIEELGLDEFVSFVFEVGNEVLTEARTLLGKKKNPQKLPKGTAPTQATKAAVAKYGTTRRFKSSSTSGVVKKNRPAAKAVEKAKETQPTKKPVRDAIARGVFGAVRAYQQGMKRHRAAMSAAKETGKTIAKAAAVTHEAGRRAGQSAAGQAIKKVGGAVIKAGVEKAKKDIKSLKKEEVEIDEAVYGGEPKKPAAPVDTRMTVTAADKKGNTQAYKNFKAGDKRYKSADHLGERTLTKDEKSEKEDYVKGMKKSKKGFEQRYGDRWKSVMYATATKMAKEETKKPSALDIVKQQVIAKHGAASLMGTPENEAARKAAAAKAKTQPKPSSKERYKDDVYSKDGLGGIRGYRSGD